MSKATPGLKDAARRLRALGWRYCYIAVVFGISQGTAHAWIDSSYVERRRQQAKEYRERLKKRTVKTNWRGNDHAFVIRAASRLMKEIPPDTRDMTAKLCGDPLPGRRAIDKTNSEAEWA